MFRKLFTFSIGCCLFSCAQSAEPEKISIMSQEVLPAGVVTDTAYFGEGCFWCTEAFFQRLKGVYAVQSGYGGGWVENPTYEQVCDKNTGHVELARIIYNPAEISFDELLEVFWKTHDPTTLNRQGNDIGTQYRSVIFYHSEAQKKIAIAYKEQLTRSKAFAKPIVTEIAPFDKFYQAEDYHQNYFNLHGDVPYCRYVVAPKVEKFKKAFKSRLKKKKDQ